MTVIKLKAVRVRDAVPFNGPTTTTLQCVHGTLEYDSDSGLVIATPFKPGGIAKALCIPPGNIVFFEILDVDKAAAQAAAPKPANFAEPIAVKPPKNDTVVLTKNSK